MAFLLYVPGAVVVNAVASLAPRRHAFAGRDEWLYTVVLVSFLLTGLVGFLLAEVGLFSAWLMLALVTVFSLIVAVTMGGRLLSSPLAIVKPPASIPRRGAERRTSRLQMGVLAVLLLVAGALFSRPAEMLRGALDSGVYVNAGVALGRTGAILQRDPLMRELNNDTGEVNELLQGMSRDRYTLDRLRMPGFYVLDKKAALVLPQHYSLFPVWIGLMYGLFGIWGALYATPLLALLGVLSVYFFARRAFSGGAALVALGLLILCPVTVWFARYPVSEVIMQVLVFSSLLAFLRMVQLTREPPMPNSAERDVPYETPQETDARGPWAGFWGLLAGVSLGEMALARPDFIFYLAPLLFYLVYWRLSRRWRQAHTWLVGSLAAMLTLYMVHLAFFAFPYTLDVYHNVIQNVRRLWGPLLLALYLGVGLLVALDRLYPRLRSIGLGAERLAARYRWVWVGALVLFVGAYLLYNYAIAPWQPNVNYTNAGKSIPQTVFTTWESYIGAPVDLGSRFNLLRIGWYLSPLGMAVGAIGLLRWIWGRLAAGTGLFLGMLLILSYVFLQETYTEAHYIYTMRRYVPIILPALILGAGWSCQWLWSRLRPRIVGASLAWLVIFGLAAFFLYTSRVIIPHVEERGAVAQLSELAQRFKHPARTVVLFSDGRDEPNLVATPLQFVYGIESFVLWRAYPNLNDKVVEGIVKRWQRDGYEVYMMMGANGGKVHFSGLSLEPVGNWQYDVPEFEQLYNQKPFNVSRSYLPWGIYRVQSGAPPAPALPFKLDIGAGDYPFMVAGFNKAEQVAPGAPFWRWTGDQAILRVPMPSSADSKTYDGAKIVLRLRPETPVEGQAPYRTQPLTVTLTLDDTPLGRVVIPLGSDFTDYSVAVPPGIPKSEPDRGTALLHIEVPTWSPKAAGASGDGRTLGVQIDEVRVEHAAQGAEPRKISNATIVEQEP